MFCIYFGYKVHPPLNCIPNVFSPRGRAGKTLAQCNAGKRAVPGLQYDTMRYNVIPYSTARYLLRCSRYCKYRYRATNRAQLKIETTDHICSLRNPKAVAAILIGYAAYPNRMLVGIPLGYVGYERVMRGSFCIPTGVF